MTAQRYDHLILDGAIVQAHTPVIPEGVPEVIYKNPNNFYASNCESGYISVWEIKDTKVYLNYVHGSCTLKTSEPIFANWITDSFYIPQGLVVEDADNIGQTHEKTLCIEVENGYVKNIKIFNNLNLLFNKIHDEKIKIDLMNQYRIRSSEVEEENRQVAARDFEENEQQFLKIKVAAEEGDIEAQVKLSEYYLAGSYTKQDIVKAASWYVNALLEEEHGENAKQRDLETIVSVLKEATLLRKEKSHGFSYLLLGMLYFEGIYETKDAQEGYHLMQKTSDDYSCIKWTCYGKTRYHGNARTDIAQDQSKALFQFLEGVNSGSVGYSFHLGNSNVTFQQSSALYYLSLLFYEGKVVHQNLISAYALALLANKKGSIEARSLMNDLSKLLTETQINEAEEFDVLPKYNQTCPWFLE